MSRATLPQDHLYPGRQYTNLRFCSQAAPMSKCGLVNGTRPRLEVGDDNSGLRSRDWVLVYV